MATEQTSETSGSPAATERDLAFAGIARQAELIREGEVSSREVTELYLRRIEQLDPHLNAFRVVLAERALAEADQADGRRGAGDERPLLGVPVAIKDEFDVAGELTANGTSATDQPATADAEVVKRLRSAGAVIIGKTHVPELCIWPFTETATFGRTRNPWDPQRSPGGSSGGSGSAVAAGMVGAALGSDGAGSIRIPAACCGLFGLKPQRGRVSLMPWPEHWRGLTVAGPLTRSVEDSALFCDAIVGPAPGDASPYPAPERPWVEAARSMPGKLRIALSFQIPPGWWYARLGEEARRATEQTAELLRSLGHSVVERDPDYGMITNEITVRYLRGIAEEANALEHPERLERRTRAMRRMGNLIPRSVLDRVLAAQQQSAQRVGRIFDDFDVLMTPQLTGTALRVGELEARGAIWTLTRSIQLTPYTGTFNATGHPAASVPAGRAADGLPLAVQLAGREGDETTLLSLAAQLEAERPWAQHRPPVS